MCQQSNSLDLNFITLEMRSLGKCSFFYNNLIEVYSTDHKIYPFTVCNSVVLSIFTELCNY